MAIDPASLPGDSVQAVESLAEVFEARSVRYALIGGLAFVLRGRPRYTRDVDFLIDVPQIALPKLLDDLIDRGATLDPAVVIKEYVRESMTSFLFDGARIDWLRPVLPLYARTLADATLLEWAEGRSVRVAMPEGLIH